MSETQTQEEKEELKTDIKNEIWNIKRGLTLSILRHVGSFRVNNYLTLGGQVYKLENARLKKVTYSELFDNVPVADLITLAEVFNVPIAPEIKSRIRNLFTFTTSYLDIDGVSIYYNSHVYYVLRPWRIFRDSGKIESNGLSFYTLSTISSVDDENGELGDEFYVKLLNGLANLLNSHDIKV